MAPPGTMLESGDQEMARSSIGLTEKVCPTPPGSVISLPTILAHFCGIIRWDEYNIRIIYSGLDCVRLTGDDSRRLHHQLNFYLSNIFRELGTVTIPCFAFGITFSPL